MVRIVCSSEGQEFVEPFFWAEQQQEHINAETKISSMRMITSGVEKHIPASSCACRVNHVALIATSSNTGFLWRQFSTYVWRAWMYSQAYVIRPH
jgi:hypothetical protein